MLTDREAMISVVSKVDTSMLSICRYEFESPWREDVFSKILDLNIIVYLYFLCNFTSSSHSHNTYGSKIIT